MGFLDGLFERKSIETKFDKPLAGSGTIASYSAGGLPSGSFNGYAMPTNQKWNIETAVEQAYGKVVWVFRSVHTIAANQASLTILQKDTSTPQGHIVDDPQFYNMINHRPNPYEDAWSFRYRLSSQCLLSPVGAFIEVIKDRQGVIRELYLLDPGTVTVIRSPKNFVDGYKVKANQEADRILKPEQVIWVKTNPHPTDPYRNMTPLEACGISVETDYFARLFNRNFLKKDGRPGMLVSVNGDILPEDADELRNLLSGGFGSAGETKIIEAEGMDFIDFGTKPRDAQWQEAADDAKAAILDAFGVPEAIFGNSTGKCLRATELVHLADGTIKPAQELVGMEFEMMQPYNGAQRSVKAKAEYARRENVYKITTFSGRSLEVNGQHPLFMAVSREKKNASSYRGTKRDIFPYGWTALKEIKRNFDENDKVQKGAYTEIAVPLWYDQLDSEYVDLDIARALGEDMEFVPDVIFQAQLEAQREFIGGLYSKHGRLSQHTGFDLYVPTRKFAQRLQMLLTRMGVVSFIGSKKMTHIVTISGFVNMRHFLEQIELDDQQGVQAAKVWDRISVKNDDIRQEGLLRTDGLPAGLIWDRILDIEDLGEDDTVAISIDDQHEHHYLSVFWEHNTINSEVSVENFWTGTMQTHCDSIARALEPITGDDTDRTFLEFDYSTIDILQQMTRRRLDQHRTDLNNGAICMNDYRVLMGLDPIDQPYFRVYFYPNGAIGGTDSDVQHVMRQMLTTKGVAGQQNPLGNPFTNNAITGGDGQVGGFNDLVQGNNALNGGDHSQTVFDQAARTMRSARVNNMPPEAVNPMQNAAVASRVNTLINKRVDREKNETKGENIHRDIYQDVRAKTMGFIEGNLESWSNRQLSVVSDRLNHAKVRKGTRHWDGGVATKDLDLDYLVNIDQWTDEAVDSIIKGLTATLVREAAIKSNDLKDTGIKSKTGSDFIMLDDIDQIIGDIQSQLVKSISQQSKLVQKHIGVQDKAGFEIEKMQETLSQPSNFDRRNWINLLAKRVTTFAIESMSDKIYSNVEAKVNKTWHTHTSESFRESHANLNNITVNCNEEFDLNGKTRFPSGILSSEGDNCSCWLVYRIEK